ncbi:MAG: hypothetical protein RBS19_05625 [Bacteroidales bacterium]|nr:hypothetical protein [Bacteroidales bacterium]
MKKNLLFFIMTCVLISLYSQKSSFKFSADSVQILSKVEFFIYEGPYGDKKIKEPAIRFIITVKNMGSEPIPDLAVSNRSKYLNLYVNDSIKNPVSLYNGLELPGHHLLFKGASDTYTWWVFENAAYSKIFTFQWKYLETFSEKYKINVPRKTIELLK